MTFKFAVRDLLMLSPRLEGMKIVVKAEVGERFLDLIEFGESATVVFNSTLKLAFLGNSPQVYKPGMPFKAYVSLQLMLMRELSGNELSVSPSLIPRFSTGRTLVPR